LTTSHSRRSRSRPHGRGAVPHGVAMKAVDAVDRAIRHVPGRLAVVAIVAGTIFSAISGSTIATTAMLGSLLLPQMLQRGYERKMAMGRSWPSAAWTYSSRPPPSPSCSQPRRHLDLRPPDRGSAARHHPERLLHWLRRRAVRSRPGPCAGAGGHTGEFSGPTLTPSSPSLPLVVIFGAVVGSMLAAGDPHRVRRARSGWPRSPSRHLSSAQLRGPGPGAHGLGRDLRLGAVHLDGAVTFSQILSFSGATSVSSNSFRMPACPRRHSSSGCC
jgi:hypothetical protein